jgi:hypothetical protein
MLVKAVALPRPEIHQSGRSISMGRLMSDSMLRLLLQLTPLNLQACLYKLMEQEPVSSQRPALWARLVR